MSPSRTARNAALIAAALFFGLSPSCTCEPEPEPPPSSAGTLRLNAVDGGLELVLSDAATPLRSLQVDVAMPSGTGIAAVSATGDLDLVTGGLAPGDAPVNELTVVVADTRRLPISNGPLALLVLDGIVPDAGVTLARGVAVDRDGVRRTLTVVAP